MIKTKEYQYRDYTGYWNGTVVSVEVEPNRFYKEDDDNSTEHVLSIEFDLVNIDDENDVYNFTQRFVSPVFGYGIFQQIIDALPESLLKGFEAGDSLDEQVLVGQEMLVELGKNNKGYTNVVSVSKSNSKKAKTAAKAVKAEKAAKEDGGEKTPDDLPF